MAAKTEKLSTSDKINEFIQKNRKILLFSLVGLLVVIIALAAFFAVRDRVATQAFTAVDAFEQRYNALRYSSEPGNWNADLVILRDEIAVFAKKNSGFAAARAYTLIAGMYESHREWAEAEKAWTSAAVSASKTYFGPVAYFNAAVAAEEHGNYESAINLYGKAMEYGAGFPSAPRAQFSIGRIYEMRGDSRSALLTYQALVGKWPSDQIWVNLAQSRILALSLDRQIP